MIEALSMREPAQFMCEKCLLILKLFLSSLKVSDQHPTPLIVSKRSVNKLLMKVFLTQVKPKGNQLCCAVFNLSQCQRRNPSIPAAVDLHLFQHKRSFVLPINVGITELETRFYRLTLSRGSPMSFFMCLRNISFIFVKNAPKLTQEEIGVIIMLSVLMPRDEWQIQGLFEVRFKYSATRQAF